MRDRKTFKRLCIVTNCLLLVWFFFDMTGLSIGSTVLVESAWDSIDGIWFLIFIGFFAFFMFKEKYGKYPLAGFHLLWFIIQFTSHWYLTIFGASDEKIAGYNRFFADTYRIIPASDSRIVPDFYHIVLHIFILLALVFVSLYCVKRRSAY